MLDDLGLAAHDITTVSAGAGGRLAATFAVVVGTGMLDLASLGVWPFHARATLRLDGVTYDAAGLSAAELALTAARTR